MFVNVRIQVAQQRRWILIGSKSWLQIHVTPQGLKDGKNQPSAQCGGEHLKLGRKKDDWVN
jgi:hypothetical protein